MKTKINKLILILFLVLSFFLCNITLGTSLGTVTFKNNELEIENLAINEVPTDGTLTVDKNNIQGTSTGALWWKKNNSWLAFEVQEEGEYNFNFQETGINPSNIIIYQLENDGGLTEISAGSEEEKKITANEGTIYIVQLRGVKEKNISNNGLSMAVTKGTNIVQEDNNNTENETQGSSNTEENTETQNLREILFEEGNQLKTEYFNGEKGDQVITGGGYTQYSIEIDQGKYFIEVNGKDKIIDTTGYDRRIILTMDDAGNIVTITRDEIDDYIDMTRDPQEGEIPQGNGETEDTAIRITNDSEGVTIDPSSGDYRFEVEKTGQYILVFLGETVPRELTEGDIIEGRIPNPNITNPPELSTQEPTDDDTDTDNNVGDTPGTQEPTDNDTGSGNNKGENSDSISGSTTENVDPEHEQKEESKDVGVFQEVLTEIGIDIGEFAFKVISEVLETETGKITIDSLVFNKVDALNPNFFDKSLQGTVVSETIKEVINKWYAYFRSLAIVIYVIAVILVAIRFLLEGTPLSRVRGQQVIIKWTLGVIILFIFPYVMKMLFEVNEAIVNKIYSQNSLGMASNKTRTINRWSRFI